MGKYGQFYGQLLTTNNFAKLFVCQLIVEAYRATLLYHFVTEMKFHTSRASKSM